MSAIVKDLSTDTIEAFASRLRGEIVLPSDPTYDDSRKVYNAMINKHPGMIVKCRDVADVMHAVNFGRENNLLVAVRGGGHNGGRASAAGRSDAPRNPSLSSHWSRDQHPCSTDTLAAHVAAGSTPARTHTHTWRAAGSMCVAN